MSERDSQPTVFSSNPSVDEIGAACITLEEVARHTPSKQAKWALDIALRALRARIETTTAHVDFRAAGWLAAPEGESLDSTISLIKNLVARIGECEKALRWMCPNHAYFTKHSSGAVETKAKPTHQTPNEKARATMETMRSILSRQAPQYCNEIRLPAEAAKNLLDEFDQALRERDYYIDAHDKACQETREALARETAALRSQVKTNDKPATENCEHGIPRRFCTAVHEDKP